MPGSAALKVGRVDAKPICDIFLFLVECSELSPAGSPVGEGESEGVSGLAKIDFTPAGIPFGGGAGALGWWLQPIVRGMRQFNPFKMADSPLVRLQSNLICSTHSGVSVYFWSGCRRESNFQAFRVLAMRRPSDLRGRNPSLRVIHSERETHTTQQIMSNEEKLIEAAANGQTKKVEKLLDSGADIHAENDAALREAARGGHFKTVELLLEKQATIVTGDETGLDCILLTAVKGGHINVVKLLIESGADLAESGGQCLIEAAENGDCDIIELLIKKGVNVLHLDGIVLVSASEEGQTKSVELLLKKGADIHAYSDGALHAAAVADHTEIVALLLCKYQTCELREMLSATMEPQLKNVIQKEFKKRLGKVVRDAVKSDPGLEI
jgi:hypothetical protein